MSTCNDTCCKTTNLLRRDGTSQRQRFPLTLAEDYVRIDERSHADMLQFIYDVAAEFNFYAGDNKVDGNWQPFFEEDLSFVLAKTLAVDLAAYRSTFELLYSALQVATIPPLGGAFAELDAIFRFFVEPTHAGLSSLNPVLEPLPQLLSKWIKLLPESDLYASGHPYTFRDLVADARMRLLPMLRKIQLAQINGSNSPYGYCANLSAIWEYLESQGWNLESVDDTNTTYFSTAQDPAEFQRILNMLRAGLDTLLGTIADLQSRMPQYLVQSLKEFGWHDPQNGLLLAFLQLFDHAREHLNKLTRRHLLYEYMDVLRFTRRPLTPDEAVVIVQLRKGVANYRLEAGTLLKAGKDKDGNPLSYAVNLETVVNQALISSLRSVFVERDDDGKITGIYASPVANSTDGKGKALPASDPKWNLFGEAQLGYLPEDRTMPDARLGWAVASPLFVMKEGQRVIDLTFIVPEEQLPGQTVGDSSEWERWCLNLRMGLTAEYTSIKGWLPAMITEVSIIQNQLVIEDRDLEPAEVGNGKLALHFRVELDEGDAPFVVYQEKIHKDGLETHWPVLRLSFEGQTDDFAHLPSGLLAFDSPYVLPSTTLVLRGGGIYHLQGGASVPVSDFDNFWALYGPMVNAYPFAAASNYLAGDLVTFDGGVYVALENVNQAVAANQNPYEYPHQWKRQFRTHLYEALYRLVPEQLHVRVAVEGAFGLLYENDFGKLKAEKPFPMFGGAPVIGSRFYIGSQEIFGKQLDHLDIDIVWQDPPDNLGRYYVGYESMQTSLQTAIDLTHTCDGTCICCIPVDFNPLTQNVTNTPPPAQGRLSSGSNSTEGRESGGTADSRDSDSFSLEFVDAEYQGQLCYTICTPNGEFILWNEQWTANIHYLYDGNWEALATRPLFYQDSNGNGARLKHRISFNKSYFERFERDLNIGEHSRLESNTPRGFIRFELASPLIAFGHKYYKDLYVKAVHNSMRTIPPRPLVPPNEPYTPVVKEIRLHYVSKSVLDFRTAGDLESVYESRVDQYFHLHPFGHTEEHAYLIPEGGKFTLIPQYAAEGCLYLGIESLSTPSTLSVLFQLAEGSGDSDLTLVSSTSSLLIANRWHELQRREILLDTTDNLITSGVIQYDLGPQFIAGSTLIDRNLHWIKLQVESGTAAYMKGIEVLAQAILVRFQDQGNNPGHLQVALPADTIVALAESHPSVKKITQPFASYGGKLPESGDNFITRVSERLRHKQRSINIWDYERLVLEEFPSIYKVKCLNHTEFKALHTNRKDWEISPGHVTVVCIPDLRNVNAVNPFEPKTSIRTLQQVDKHLKKHVSSWVDLKVKNPLYEGIRIRCKIGFVQGKDPGYYTQVLERAIQEFLSPWAFDHNHEIVFGGKIHRSKVIQLIEQQDYVDYVLDFMMDHVVDGKENPDVLEAVATTGRSILVSSLQHRITAVKPDCAYCEPATIESSDCGCCGEETVSNPGSGSTN